MRMLVAEESVLYCTVLYCTVLYCTVLYCTAPGPPQQPVLQPHHRAQVPDSSDDMMVRLQWAVLSALVQAACAGGSGLGDALVLPPPGAGRAHPPHAGARRAQLPLPVPDPHGAAGRPRAPRPPPQHGLAPPSPPRGQQILPRQELRSAL